MQQQELNVWEQSLSRFTALEKPIEVESLVIGAGDLALIAGPCAIESEYICLSVAEHLVSLANDLKIPYIFKASFDKANRTSINSFRGGGLINGLKVLNKVKEEYKVPVLTDVHETSQIEAVSEIVDVLQIPAFLCRQTDLLIESGKTGKPVNIKKGQFFSPDDAGFASEKVKDTGNEKVMLTERGAVFGYRDLIVDMRSLVTMRSFGHPVIFDATHSVQQMGGLGGASGGLTQFIPAQVRGAVAVGIDGLFVETHPDPSKALSDGSTMVPLQYMSELLKMALDIHATHFG